MRDEQNLFPRIIHEDKWLLIIDKPSGWTVLFPGQKQSKLQRWLAEKRNLLSLPRTGIVHRLDKDTSGIMLVAKTKPVFEKLQEAFKERTVEKEYLALVKGKPPKTGTIKAPIGRFAGAKNKFVVRPGGRKSVTRYQREKIYREGNEFFSYLRIWPETGRTHQIRVHLKYLGYPLAGDPLYGSDKHHFFPRLFLHARKITFTHPVFKRRISFVSRLAVELEQILAKLKVDHD